MRATSATTLMILCVTFAAASRAQSQISVAIDGDYVGSWTYVGLGINRMFLGMQCVDLNGASGLTSVSLFEEGPAPDGLIYPSQGAIHVSNDAGDYLFGTFPGTSNWGVTTTFQITGGTGPFAGAQGGGGLIVMNTFPSPTGFSTGPSRILINGNASIPPPVPEPSSMALLVGPGIFGFLRFRRHRRSREKPDCVTFTARNRLGVEAF
jgi:hypothetical protein